MTKIETLILCALCVGSNAFTINAMRIVDVNGKPDIESEITIQKMISKDSIDNQEQGKLKKKRSFEYLENCEVLSNKKQKTESNKEISSEEITKIYQSALKNNNIKVLEKFNRYFIAIAHNFIYTANNNLRYPKKYLNEIELYTHFVWEQSLLTAEKNGYSETVIGIVEHLNQVYGSKLRELIPLKSISRVPLSSKDIKIMDFYHNSLTTSEEKKAFLTKHLALELDWPAGVTFHEQMAFLSNYAHVLKYDKEIIQRYLGFYNKLWTWENLLNLAAKLDLGSPGVHYILKKLNIEPEDIGVALKSKGNKDNNKATLLGEVVRDAIDNKKNCFIEALKGYKIEKKEVN